MKHKDLNERTLDLLDELADNRLEFTFPQLRRKLGIGADDTKQLTALWNFWRSLLEVEAVSELPSNRKRNRIFVVASKAKLQLFRPTFDAESFQANPDRLAELESRVVALERQLSLMKNVFAGT